jgi:hypothetical protein
MLCFEFALVMNIYDAYVCAYINMCICKYFRDTCASFCAGPIGRAGSSKVTTMTTETKPVSLTCEIQG